ncbi:hypothetical protein HDU97_002139 [Phlyctochytrium planicorne]|nr:hypothetical protein HDU97_002139 [Phlyctochytrium planicorne]
MSDSIDCPELHKAFPEIAPEKDCCNAAQYGVFCLNGRVTRISWPWGGSRPKLARAMPNISKLTDLVYLDLSMHEMTGEFPNHIFGLTKLQQIRLSHNQFTGQLSEDIGNLKNMVLLQIQNNYFTGAISDDIKNNIGTFLFESNCITSGFEPQNQRPQTECDNFFKSIPVEETSMTVLPSQQTTKKPDSVPVKTTINVSDDYSSTDIGPPYNAIIGAAVGTLVLIALACTIVFVNMRRRRQQTKMDEIFDSTVASYNRSTGSEGGAGRWNELQNLNTDDETSLQSGETVPKSVEARYPDVHSNLFPSTMELVVQDAEPQWPVAIPSPPQQLQEQPTDDSTDTISRIPLAFPPITTAIIFSSSAATMPSAIPDLHPSSSPIDTKFFYNRNTSLQSNQATTPPTTTTTIEEAWRWTSTQVAEWLESVDFSARLAAMLKGHGVTGYQLLVMTEERLVEMGIEHPLSRRMIMEAAEMLRVGSHYGGGDRGDGDVHGNGGVDASTESAIDTPGPEEVPSHPRPTLRAEMSFDDCSIVIPIFGLQRNCCDLKGKIDCRNGRITAVRIPGTDAQRLSGGFPDLSGLAALEILDISQHQFSGQLPDYLYRLARLKELHLNRNKFTGGISDDVGNLKELRVLSIHSNNFIGKLPSGLGSLPNAVYIELHQNQFQGEVPSSFSNLRVDKLSLNTNRLYGELDGGFGNILRSGASQVDLGGNYLRGNPGLQQNFNDPSRPNPTSRPGGPSNGTTQQPNTSSPDTATSQSTSSAPLIGGIAGAVILAALVAAILGFIYKRRSIKISEKGANILPQRSGSAASGGSWNEMDTMKGIESGAVGLTAPPRTAINPPPRFHSKEKQDMVVGGSRIDGVGATAMVSGAYAYQNSTEAPMYPTYNPHQPPTEPTLFPTRQPTIVEKQKHDESGFPYIPDRSIITPITIHPDTKPLDPTMQPQIFPAQHPRRSSISKSAYNPSTHQPMPTHSHHHVASISEASSWTPDQVSQWLESVDVSPRLAVILKEHGVTGYQLLVMTEERMLEMGIELPLSRRMVMEAVEMLRAGSSGAGASNSGAERSAPAAPPQYY